MVRQTLAPLVAGSFLLLGSGCGPTQSPTLCIFTSDDFKDKNADETPETFSCPTPVDVAKWGTEPEQCDGTITADGVIYVRHTLPEGVIPSSPLNLRVETPCESTTYEVSYANGIALWSGEPPDGAACSFMVTATLANSELRCSFQSNNATDCKSVCPDAANP